MRREICTLSNFCPLLAPCGAMDYNREKPLQGDDTMNIQELLHSFPCTCGHEHRCDIQHVEIGRGAVSALTAICSATVGGIRCSGASTSPLRFTVIITGVTVSLLPSAFAPVR